MYFMQHCFNCRPTDSNHEFYEKLNSRYHDVHTVIIFVGACACYNFAYLAQSRGCFSNRSIVGHDAVNAVVVAVDGSCGGGGSG